MHIGHTTCTRWKYGNRAGLLTWHSKRMAKKNEKFKIGAPRKYLQPEEHPPQEISLPIASYHMLLRTMQNNHDSDTGPRAPLGRIHLNLPSSPSLWTSQNVWNQSAKPIHGTNGCTYPHAAKIFQPATRPHRVSTTNAHRSWSVELDMSVNSFSIIKDHADICIV